MRRSAVGGRRGSRNRSLRALEQLRDTPDTITSRRSMRRRWQRTSPRRAWQLAPARVRVGGTGVVVVAGPAQAVGGPSQGVAALSSTSHATTASPPPRWAASPSECEVGRPHVDAHAQAQRDRAALQPLHPLLTDPPVCVIYVRYIYLYILHTIYIYTIYIVYIYIYNIWYYIHVLLYYDRQKPCWAP